MAASAISTCGRDDCNSFKASLGNDELTLRYDSERDRLLIEVASSSKFVIYRKLISKQEEIRQITGAFVCLIIRNIHYHKFVMLGLCRQVGCSQKIDMSALLNA